MEEKKRQSFKKRQKELILRALTDPAFRKLLMSDPAKALGKKITIEIRKEIKMILAAVKGIEAQISALADELLCANGGPCGIA
ncbi:MAG: hypothetical protein HZC12_07790 [Nitrospirae bacterium]|nr:hypothetical protein [Nitrospirota bacterium]